MQPSLINRWSVALSLSALGLACGPNRNAAPPVPPPLIVQVETLAPTEVEDTSEYVATLVSRRSVTIYPVVSGYVREILVKPGQEVKRGERLIRIDARQEAAALTQTQAELNQAETQLELAATTRQRMAALQKEGIRSRQDYENAVAAEQAARANVQAARATVQSRSVQLAYHDVSAPTAGTVGDIVVKIGDSVTPQTVLTQVDESGRLELSVEVPVERADEARVGQTPLELLDGEGKPQLRAPVFFVAPRPDPRSQLVELRAAFANAAGLRSGQRVRARVVWRTFPALTVPTFAITRQSGQAFLFVVRARKQDGGASGEVVERRPVSLGLIAGDRWTITSGVQAGERIAVTQLQALRDGQLVRTVAPEAGAAGGAAQGRGQGAR